MGLLLIAASARDEIVHIDATPQADVSGSKGFTCQTPCRMPANLDNQHLTFKWSDGRQTTITAPRVVTPEGGALMVNENAVLVSTAGRIAIERLPSENRPW
jgi:hypothetical protein